MTEAPRTFIGGTPIPEIVYICKNPGEGPLHIFTSPEQVIAHLSQLQPREALLWQVFRVTLLSARVLEFIPPGKAIIREKDLPSPPASGRPDRLLVSERPEHDGRSGTSTTLDAGSSGAVQVIGGSVNLAGRGGGGLTPGGSCRTEGSSGMQPQDRHG